MADDNRSGAAPDSARIIRNIFDPWWMWAEPRPDRYDRDDNRLYGGDLEAAPYWLVWYHGLVDPNADLPLWTEHLLGAIAHGATGGLFTVLDNVPAGYLYYDITDNEVATLDNALGTLLETRCRIITTVGGVSQGVCLSICDGAYQFMAWLREDGVNLAGQANVAIDMARWRHVSLTAQDVFADLYVDGEPIQSGGPFQASVARRVSFGSYVTV